MISLTCSGGRMPESSRSTSWAGAEERGARGEFQREFLDHRFELGRAHHAEIGGGARDTLEFGRFEAPHQTPCDVRIKGEHQGGDLVGAFQFRAVWAWRPRRPQAPSSWIIPWHACKLCAIRCGPARPASQNPTPAALRRDDLGQRDAEAGIVVPRPRPPRRAPRRAPFTTTSTGSPTR